MDSISQCLIRDPVLGANSQVHEKTSLIRWFKQTYGRRVWKKKNVLHVIDPVNKVEFVLDLNRKFQNALNYKEQLEEAMLRLEAEENSNKGTASGGND